LGTAIGITTSQVHGLIGKARAQKLVIKSGNGYRLKAG
jgi:hypothetical protein